jgi:crotonobetainyl-CoA:carnitine CoA-transferase CaiB-like acyl-CoA transferase
LDALGVGAADDPSEPLAAALASRPATDAFKLLDDAGVPVEIVNEEFCRDLFDDPEARALGWVATTTAGGVGRFEDPGLLIGFSATPGTVQRGPCLCGQHTREIHREIGYADERIDELVAAGVVLDAPVAPDAPDAPDAPVVPGA